MPALSAVLSTRVGRHRKFGEVSCTECTGQENDFELIPMVKMETRNPVEGYFGSEFFAICNHCGVIVAEVVHRLFVCFAGRGLAYSGACTETYKLVQCASPGRGGELVGVCGVCARCVGWRKA